MEKKIFTSPLNFKDGDGEIGEFTAVFARFNVVDKDGDVTVKGAFTEGQEVRISYWGHRWQDLPVGVGRIHSDEEKAWVEGKFFLNTQTGREHYETVKSLGSLQEWSYGFDILDSETGELDGKSVNFLKKLEVYEVSPVLLGAGIGTGTTAIKSADDQKEDTNPDEDEIVESEKSSVQGGLSLDDFKKIFSLFTGG